MTRQHVSHEDTCQAFEAELQLKTNMFSELIFFMTCLIPKAPFNSWKNTLNHSLKYPESETFSFCRNLFQILDLFPDLFDQQFQFH